jgi:hypothetical protein
MGVVRVNNRKRVSKLHYNLNKMPAESQVPRMLIKSAATYIRFCFTQRHGFNVSSMAAVSSQSAPPERFC